MQWFGSSHQEEKEQEQEGEVPKQDAKESKNNRIRIIGNETNANETSQPAKNLAEKRNTDFHP
jgi:hypothetical protein